jgi:oligosaccharide 4-alpha-D-glucosyltransferase
MRYLKNFVFLLATYFLFQSGMIAQSNTPKPRDYISHTMSGNKLFVYTGSNVYSFAPYGDEMVRIGFHFGQDTTYPVSQSVVMQPEGTATVDDSGNFLYYSTWDFLVKIRKSPLDFSVSVNGDTLIRQGVASVSGDGSLMQFRADAASAWYGGGSRAIPMNRAGYDLYMLNEPFYGYGWGYDRLNICIPVAVSSKGFGLYFENASPGDLSLGNTVPGQISYAATEGPLSCFVIRSADPDSLTQPYTELTGRQPMPPIWALGYIQSKFGYENETEATGMVNQMIAQGFPMDAIIFDLQWQGGVSEMGNLDWDPSRFPDPEGMIQDFRSKGVKSVCIADPYFTQDCQYFGMLQGVGWFAKKQNNQAYILNDFWAGPSGLLDITNPSAANWFWQRCKSLIDGGVEGLWTDLGEPERAPEDMVFTAGSCRAVRQTYNLRWSGGLYNSYMQAFPDRRPFILTRSGYAGMQRYSTFPWSGDVQKTFGGMRSQIPIMLGMGLCGIGFMHADVGGFTGDFNAELYCRWQQMGAFFPVMRAHGVGVAPEPINYPEPYKSIVRDYIKLRYSMLPYNYTLAYENSISGMPLARPLFFEDPQLTDVDDEYLWGPDLLVAPVLEEGAVSRPVVFPQGSWVGFFNWNAYQGGQYATVDAPLDQMPVFVKAGALIPTIPEVQNTEEYLANHYIIKYFADPEVRYSSGQIYIDDGLTGKATTQGMYSLVSIDADYQAELAQIELTRTGAGFEGEPVQKTMEVEVERCKEAPSSVTFNEIPVNMVIDMASYDQANQAAIYLEDKHQLLVKADWDSQNAGGIKIGGLKVTNSFSVPENKPARVSVYPNPVREDSRLQLNIIEPGSYTLELINSLGQQLGNHTEEFTTPGQFSYSLNDLFSINYLPGTYLLRISDQNGSGTTVKIIITP